MNEHAEQVQREASARSKLRAELADIIRTAHTWMADDKLAAVIDAAATAITDAVADAVDQHAFDTRLDAAVTRLEAEGYRIVDGG
jgi:hypothetical protein